MLLQTLVGGPEEYEFTSKKFVKKIITDLIVNPFESVIFKTFFLFDVLFLEVLTFLTV